MIDDRRPILMLAADHRRSFERIFGLEPPIGDDDHRRLCAAKQLVVEALDVARAIRPELVGAGVLLDDHYGAAALATAARLGIDPAMAFEVSGRDVLEFEHDDWIDRLDALAEIDGASAKVLVRHRADGDPAANAIQLARLREISDACAARPVSFLLELLTPFSADEQATTAAAELELELRPRLIVAAMAEMQAAGIAADVWKIEGVADAGACAAIAAQARAGGRDHVGVVVLGAGAPTDTVNAWLNAARSGGYDGFAVGRSIWVDALAAHDRGEIDADAAHRQIAASYLDFVEVFLGT